MKKQKKKPFQTSNKRWKIKRRTRDAFQGIE